MRKRSLLRLLAGTTVFLSCVALVAFLYVARLALPLSPSTIRELREASIPLVTPEAGHGFDNMRALRQVIGDARVVALGEATHGTREFFQLKHRMLEFLVAEMGFEVFAIEANAPECLAVNDYVLNGRGDPRRALAGLGFWTWYTEEVLEMIQWMRQWNADPLHVRKVKFTGFDMQSPQASARAVASYLQKWDPAECAELDAVLPMLLEPREAGPSGETERQALKRVVTRVVDRLDKDRTRFVASSSEREWAEIRQHARALVQYEEMFRDESQNLGKALNVRDRAMAENALWVLEQGGPSARMVLWAHNGHVAFGGYEKVIPMGVHLRRALGADLVVLGFAFDHGRFRALAGLDRPVAEFAVEPAFRGSLEWGLRKVGYPLFVLDLRRIPLGSDAAKWLALHRATRSIGAVFDPRHPDRSWSRHSVLDRYDAIVFFEATSSARPVVPEGSPSGRS